MTLIREGLSGFDYFKRMIAGEVPPPPMLALLGIRLVEAEAGRVVFTTTESGTLIDTCGGLSGMPAS